MYFSTRNSVIAHLYGCIIVASLTKKLKLHERCLRIIYGDKKSSFEELLEKDSSVSIPQRNIQILAIECIKLAKACHLLSSDNRIFRKKK